MNITCNPIEINTRLCIIIMNVVYNCNECYYTIVINAIFNSNDACNIVMNAIYRPIIVTNAIYNNNERCRYNSNERCMQ